MITASGALQLPAVTPTALGANADDYAGTDGASFARISSTAAVNITGFANGTDGRVLVLVNVGTNAITITHQDTSSAAANRVITANGLGQVLAQDDALELIYDATTLRWRQVTGLV